MLSEQERCYEHEVRVLYITSTIYIMRLIVISFNQTLFDLSFIQNKTKINFCHPEMKVSVEKWIESGLFDWVPAEDLGYDKYDQYDTVPIRIKSYEPEFLWSLKSYLQKQFPSLTYRLIEDEI